MLQPKFSPALVGGLKNFFEGHFVKFSNPTRGDRTLARSWRGHQDHFWLGWRGHGAVMAQSCPVPPDPLDFEAPQAPQRVGGAAVGAKEHIKRMDHWFRSPQKKEVWRPLDLWRPF